MEDIEETDARRTGAPHVVVCGAGFAGLETARALSRAGIRVTLIDRQNHHLFQPLIYQVATAALAAPDVAQPVRQMVRSLDSVTVLLAEVHTIETEQGRVVLEDGQTVSYDWLVVATGATHGWFGHAQWAHHAYGLKTLEDARSIRAATLRNFETAERSEEEAVRSQLMTMIVAGGGPTGVEMAGSLAELCRFTLARDFRRISPAAARIVLLEAGPRLLPSFTQKASDFALSRLERLGVEVRTGTAVDDIAEGRVKAGGEIIEAGLVVWAAGVAASPLAAGLGGTRDRAGRVVVRGDFTVPGVERVLVLGDAASFAAADGRPLPGLAQVAKQQGRHAGKSLAAHLLRGEPLAEFTYRSRGNTAIVGRHAAVFETRRLSLTGWLAWLAWAIIHVYLLSGFEQRLLVAIQWLWRYLTYERGARVFSEPEDLKMRLPRRPSG